jgi:hypothetical protein
LPANMAVWSRFVEVIEAMRTSLEDCAAICQVCIALYGNLLDVQADASLRDLALKLDQMGDMPNLQINTFEMEFLPVSRHLVHLYDVHVHFVPTTESCTQLFRSLFYKSPPYKPSLEAC